MLLRVRIRELLSTALLEAPPNANTSDQEKWGPMKGPRWPPWHPVETPLLIALNFFVFGRIAACLKTVNCANNVMR